MSKGTQRDGVILCGTLSSKLQHHKISYASVFEEQRIVSSTGVVCAPERWAFHSKHSQIRTNCAATPGPPLMPVELQQKAQPSQTLHLACGKPSVSVEAVSRCLLGHKPDYISAAICCRLLCSMSQFPPPPPGSWASPLGSRPPCPASLFFRVPVLSCASPPPPPPPLLSSGPPSSSFLSPVPPHANAGHVAQRGPIALDLSRDFYDIQFAGKSAYS